MTTLAIIAPLLVVLGIVLLVGGLGAMLSVCDREWLGIE
jgi:hypothetical protein